MAPTRDLFTFFPAAWHLRPGPAGSRQGQVPADIASVGLLGVV